MDGNRQQAPASYSTLLKGRRMVTAKQAEVRRLAREGMPLDEVARTVKVSMDYVLKTVHNGGQLEDAPKPKAPAEKLPPVKERPTKKWSYAVDRDEPPATPARKDVDAVTPSNASREVTAEEEATIVALRRDGVQPAEISERTGRSKSAVTRVLKDNGLTRTYKPRAKTPAKPKAAKPKAARKRKTARPKASTPPPPVQANGVGHAEELLAAARVIEAWSELPGPLQDYVRHAIAGGGDA